MRACLNMSTERSDAVNSRIVASRDLKLTECVLPHLDASVSTLQLVSDTVAMKHEFSLLVVFFVITVISDGVRGEDSRKNDALAELRDLYSKTAPDSMRCWFKLTEASKQKCKAETLEYKKTLLKRVRQYWLTDGYITPENGNCVRGYAQFSIGSFNDPVLLPCDEHAFDAPKHTDEEIDDMYRTLLALYNDYKSCERHKGTNCDKYLKAELKYAEDEDMIPRNCQRSGYGMYSFYTGMDEVECPCIFTDTVTRTKTTT